MRQHEDGLADGEAPEVHRRGDWLRVPCGRNRSQLARNQTRDRFDTRTLRRAAWRKLRIWDGARQRGDRRAHKLVNVYADRIEAMD